MSFHLCNRINLILVSTAAASGLLIKVTHSPPQRALHLGQVHAQVLGQHVGLLAGEVVLSGLLADSQKYDSIDTCHPSHLGLQTLYLLVQVGRQIHQVGVQVVLVGLDGLTSQLQVALTGHNAVYVVHNGFESL